MLLTNSKDDIKHCVLWLHGLSSFQEKNTKFEDKNQHTQRKLFNLANVKGGVKKCQNLTFNVKFLRQKSSESLSLN